MKRITLHGLVGVVMTRATADEQEIYGSAIAHHSDPE
jgi:hypothetical protein